MKELHPKMKRELRALSLVVNVLNKAMPYLSYASRRWLLEWITAQRYFSEVKQ